MRTSIAAAAFVAAVTLAAAGCGDSTDIGGTYSGNATYTLSTPSGSGAFGAGFATIEIGDEPSGAAVDIGSACDLSAAQDEQLTITNKSGESSFVFTTESVEQGQPCTLPLGGIDFSVTEGNLIVEHGLTMTLDIGGKITNAPDPSAIGGYVVYQFSGQQ